VRTGPLPYIAVLTKRVAPLVARAQELRLPAPELDVHDLLATARRQALLEDFGPGDFRPGLDLLVDSINADVRPDRAGAQLLRELIGAQLRNRVGVRDWSKKNPDSRIEAISAPIVICGLPGSGVDLLAGLIGHDAETRVLRLGEALVTAPPGGALPETYRPDPRSPAVADLAQRVRRVTVTGDSGFPEPSLPAGGDVALGGHFFAPLGAALLGATSYLEWTATADAEPAYRWQHSVLQALQACEPTTQWVLHGSVHLGHLDALLAVHPDARIVWVHRDPAGTAGHEAALASRVRGLVTNPSAVTDARAGVSDDRRLSSHLDQLDRAGAVVQERSLDVLHLHHVELHADPVGTVARIYRRFGLDVPTAARWRMDAWLTRRSGPTTAGTWNGTALQALAPTDAERRERYLKHREVLPEHAG